MKIAAHAVSALAGLAAVIPRQASTDLAPRQVTTPDPETFPTQCVSQCSRFTTIFDQIEPLCMSASTDDLTKCVAAVCTNDFNTAVSTCVKCLSSDPTWGPTAATLQNGMATIQAACPNSPAGPTGGAVQGTATEVNAPAGNLPTNTAVQNTVPPAGGNTMGNMPGNTVGNVPPANTAVAPGTQGGNTVVPQGNNPQQSQPPARPPPPSSAQSLAPGALLALGLVALAF